MDPVDSLTLVVSDHGAARRLTARGELDLTTSPALQERVLGELERGRDLELDLTGVPFADASALRVLVRAEDRARELGVALVLCGPLPVQFARALRLSGLTGRVPVHPVHGDPPPGRVAGPPFRPAES